MDPDKYIFPPLATSEATLNELIERLVADGVDEDSLIDTKLSETEHELHATAVMFYITALEFGKIENGFVHTDEVYQEVLTGVTALGPKHPMSILFRIYDEHANKGGQCESHCVDADIEQLDTEAIKIGIEELIHAFIDFAVGSGVNTSSPSALHEAVEGFIETDFINDSLSDSWNNTPSKTSSDLTLNEYNGDITEVISNVLDQFKSSGISPMSVYASKELFDSASTRYAEYLMPIVMFEVQHNFDVEQMKNAAIGDANLIEHVLAGIQKFPDMDPLGVALQVFKKRVLDSQF